MRIPDAELQAAKIAYLKIPENLQGFYVAHFQIIPDTGKFVGLVCKVCNRWLEYNHDKYCPVGKL